MKIRLLTTAGELAALFRDWCRKATDIRVVTAWATLECPACKELTAARGTISTLVVGLDFFQTAPSFLQSLRSSIRIGHAAGGATFHPKIYLFQNEDSYCCIIGSSNFTGGGFGNNVELNVSVVGNVADSFFPQVAAFVDSQEERSAEITRSEIADYRKQFDRLAAARKRLEKYRPSPKGNIATRAERSKVAAGLVPPEQLNKTWKEYVDLIVAQEKRQDLVLQGTEDEPGYLETAEHCQELFGKYGRLSKMPLDGRRYVGGTTMVAGWFGSMRGNGLFGQRLKDNPASLDAALGHIPIKGDLRRGQFDAFVAHYQWKKSGVGTASRLLAMKRPDLFVCIDAENRPQIAAALSVTAGSLATFPGYWDLLQRIWKCPWWRAGRPKDALGLRIWKARVALLDSVYYLAR
jgi:hypothetical protein